MANGEKLGTCDKHWGNHGLHSMWDACVNWREQSQEPSRLPKEAFWPPNCSEGQNCKKCHKCYSLGKPLPYPDEPVASPRSGMGAREWRQSHPDQVIQGGEIWWSDNRVEAYAAEQVRQAEAELEEYKTAFDNQRKVIAELRRERDTLKTQLVFEKSQVWKEREARERAERALREAEEALLRVGIDDSHMAEMSYSCNVCLGYSKFDPATSCVIITHKQGCAVDAAEKRRALAVKSSESTKG